MCHACRLPTISHLDLLCLDSSLFTKIAEVLDPITLNTIIPWSFPVIHYLTLFCFLFNTFDYSFLKVFINPQFIRDIFQPLYFSDMPILDVPKVNPKSFTFFSIWYINPLLSSALGLNPSPLKSAYRFF